MCSEYRDVFCLPGDKLSVNNFYKQKIRLQDESPVYIKKYRNAYNQRDEICRQVDKLVENDLIEPSLSSYNSPILLVPKKSVGGPKMENSSGLSAAEQKNKFPLR